MKSLLVCAASVHGLLALVANLLVNPLSSQVSSLALTPVKMGKCYAYLDGQGSVVLPAIYQQAYFFREGLALARTHGNYGYIDSTGSFVIKEQFDYAFSFHEGVAKVFRGEKSFYINKQGEPIFTHPYKTVFRLNQHLYATASGNGSFGLINANGRLILDTVLCDKPYLSDRHLLLVRYQAKDSLLKPWQRGREYAIAEENGDICVPFGKYQEIEGFEGDIFRVIEKTDGKVVKESLISMHKQVLGSCTCGNSDCLTPLGKDGMFTKTVVAKYSDSIWKTLEWNQRYSILFSAKGDTLNADTNCLKWEYKNKWLLAKNKAYQWQVYDTLGKKVNEIYFSEYEHLDGHPNHLWVRTKEGWGKINRQAEYLVEPNFLNVHWDDRNGKWFLFSSRGAEANDRFSRIYGLADSSGKKVILARFTDVMAINAVTQCMYVKMYERHQLVSFDNRVLWELPDSLCEQAYPFNTDAMTRAYFYAKGKVKGRHFIAHGNSSNTPCKIRKENIKAPFGLSIQVDENANDKLKPNILAREVRLINNGVGPKVFPAQDYRLSMWTEAMDSLGIWKAIEYLPRSWCGHSYHNLILDAGSFWRFTVPVYEGSTPTKLRIAVTYQNKYSKEAHVLYSAPFMGSINPAQFWRKDSYTPNGIMDPYNE